MLHTVSDLRERYTAGRSLLDALQGILEADDIDGATAVTCDFVTQLGGKLLSLKFADSAGMMSTVRPYTAYPDSIRQISVAMQPYGGCPFYKESRKRLNPFSYSAVDRSLYKTLNDRIFFRELDQLGYGEILVLPVVIGRGIAVTTIGLPKQSDTSATQRAIRDAFPNIVAAFISKFPEVTTLFERKLLTTVERQTVYALSCGKSSDQTCRELKLNPVTFSLIIRSASAKLGANNLVELGIKAVSTGELGFSPEDG